MNLLRLAGLLPLTLLTAVGGPSPLRCAEPPSMPNQLTIHADQPAGTISRNIYGQFAEHLGRCIYEGIWVGEDSPIPNTRGIRNDVVAALKELQVPVLRWPGGCFADEYHWKDGIGPREKRPSMINTHWGGVVENNHFGTHEFFDLCEQLGCDAYVCGNVGSGTPQEMMEWVEYMTSRRQLPHGQPAPRRTAATNRGSSNTSASATRAGAAAATCARSITRTISAATTRSSKTTAASKIERIACGPNSENYDWTEVLMTMVGPRMNGLSLHYYTVSYGPLGQEKGRPRVSRPGEWFATLWQALRMDDHRDQTRRHHGPLRPAKAHRHGRRRMGRMVRRGTRHEPGFPLPAKQHPRRAGRRR